jgi:hypothetical protein
MPTKHVWVRRLEQKDIPQLSQWLLDTPDNHYDKEIFFYPQTITLVAHKDRNLVFMPLQLTITLESLAVNPENTNTETSLSMAELMRTAVYEANLRGVKEIYFVGTNADTIKFAEHRNFEKIEHPVFRIKLDELP